MPLPTHLNEADYQKFFPAAADEFPLVRDEEHYIDAWLLNSAYDSLLSIEQYLIDWSGSIESPLGYDIVGADGEFLIPIPVARYPAYKFVLAWDSQLLAENIAAGVQVFGVVGTFAGGAGGPVASLPALAVISENIVAADPPAAAFDTAVPSVAVPTVSSP